MSQPPKKPQTRVRLLDRRSDEAVHPNSPTESTVNLLKAQAVAAAAAAKRFADKLEAERSKHVGLKDQELLAAAEVGDAEKLKRLIHQGADIKQKDLFGRTALHLAVHAGDEASIVTLLKAGSKPNEKDDVGMTPLSICIFRRPNARIAELLFKYGAKILRRTSPMDTGIFIQFVMMCTPTEEEAKIMKLLVENGALVDDPGAPGKRQALHFAAMSNNCKLIRLLIHFGADLFALNHRNETPLQVAKIFNCKEAVECLSKIERNSVSFEDPGPRVSTMESRREKNKRRIKGKCSQ